jgi:1-acyl-sn-glycerol-3-phosphate acyltransferase
MKNKVIHFWIILNTIYITLRYSLPMVFRILIGQGDRQRNNHYIRLWAQKLLAVIDVDYTVFNPHQIDFKQPGHYIVMCNHASLYDIPLSFMAIDGTLRMVAKKELSRIPWFGYALKKSEFIFIDRQNRTQAVQDLKKASDLMQSGVIMWMAPEGTRSPDGQLLPLKKGGFMMALETGATIIPLGIRGANHIVEHKTFKMKRHQKVELHIGRPIEASQYTIKTRAQLMEDFEKELKRAMGV